MAPSFSRLATSTMSVVKTATTATTATLRSCLPSSPLNALTKQLSDASAKENISAYTIFSRPATLGRMALLGEVAQDLKASGTQLYHTWKHTRSLTKKSAADTGSHPIANSTADATQYGAVSDENLDAHTNIAPNKYQFIDDLVQENTHEIDRMALTKALINANKAKLTRYTRELETEENNLGKLNPLTNPSAVAASNDRCAALTLKKTTTAQAIKAFKTLKQNQSCEALEGLENSTKKQAQKQKDDSIHRNEAYYRNKATHYFIAANCAHLDKDASPSKDLKDLKDMEDMKDMDAVSDAGSTSSSVARSISEKISHSISRQSSGSIPMHANETTMNVKNSWCKAARLAYLPRVLGSGLLHIGGNVSSLIGALMACTPAVIAGFSLTAASRIISDIGMGMFRIRLKAFEELQCHEYGFTRPSGIVEKGAGIKEARQDFKLALKEAMQSPRIRDNLIKHIHLKSSNVLDDVQTDYNDDEQKIIKKLKNALLALKAARYREKNELHGSAAQLKTNIILGALQLGLNVLRFIPEPLIKLIVIPTNIGIACLQHSLNMVNAADDFVRKMDQTIISALNIATETHAIEHQHHLDQPLSDSNLKSLTETWVHPKQYRLKALIEYTQLNSAKHIQQLADLKKQQMATFEQLRSITATGIAAPTEDMQDMSLEAMVDAHMQQYRQPRYHPTRTEFKYGKTYFDWRDAQRLQRRLKAQQAKINETCDDLKTAQQDIALLTRLQKVKISADGLAIIEQLSPHLSGACTDVSQAHALMVQAKYMIEGERWRYLCSYVCPSITSSVLLLPVFASLANPADFNLTQPQTFALSGTCATFLGASQQTSSSVNAAARDNFKIEIQKANTGEKVTSIALKDFHQLQAFNLKNAKIVEACAHALKINVDDDSVKNTSSVTLDTSKYKNHASLSLKQKLTTSAKLFIECSLGIFYGIYQHNKASTTINTHGSGIMQL